MLIKPTTLVSQNMKKMSWLLVFRQWCVAGAFDDIWRVVPPRRSSAPCHRYHVPIKNIPQPVYSAHRHTDVLMSSCPHQISSRRSERRPPNETAELPSPAAPPLSASSQAITPVNCYCFSSSHLCIQTQCGSFRCCRGRSSMGWGEEGEGRCGDRCGEVVPF